MDVEKELEGTVKATMAEARRSSEATRAEVALVTAGRLKVHTMEGLRIAEDGWTITEEGLKRLSDRGWPQPKLLAGRFAGRAVMKFLKTGNGGTVLLPWVELLGVRWKRWTGRTTLRCRYLLYAMFRTRGTIIKDYCVATRIAGEKKAEEWRSKSRNSFGKVDQASQSSALLVRR